MFMTIYIGIILKDALVNRLHVNFLSYAHRFMSIIISHMKDHFIYVYQDIYTTSIVAKYLDTATVNTDAKSYKITLPYDMIFTKADASPSNEQVKK